MEPTTGKALMDARLELPLATVAEQADTARRLEALASLIRCAREPMWRETYTGWAARLAQQSPWWYGW